MVIDVNVLTSEWTIAGVVATFLFAFISLFLGIKSTIQISKIRRVEARERILNDIIEVLNRHNIYKLLIMNSHGGNDFRQILRELGLKFPKMFLSSCNWYSSINKAEYFDHNGDHADEMETSLLLYLAPNLILPLTEAGYGIEKKIKIDGIKEGWAWAERRWSSATEDTGIGNPLNATKEKGERYFNAVTDKMSQLFIDIANADLNDLYE